MESDHHDEESASAQIGNITDGIWASIMGQNSIRPWKGLELPNCEEVDNIQKPIFKKQLDWTRV